MNAAMAMLYLRVFPLGPLWYGWRAPDELNQHGWAPWTAAAWRKAAKAAGAAL